MIIDCEDCDGNGELYGDDGTSTGEDCPTCNGEGEVDEKDDGSIEVLL